VAQATATADGTRVPDFMMQAYSGQNPGPVKASVPRICCGGLSASRFHQPFTTPNRPVTPPRTRRRS